MVAAAQHAPTNGGGSAPPWAARQEQQGVQRPTYVLRGTVRIRSNTRKCPMKHLELILSRLAMGGDMELRSSCMRPPAIRKCPKTIKYPTCIHSKGFAPMPDAPAQAAAVWVRGRWDGLNDGAPPSARQPPAPHCQPVGVLQRLDT